MSNSTYTRAAEKAEQELKSLESRHAQLEKRIAHLRNLISAAAALGGSNHYRPARTVVAVGDSMSMADKVEVVLKGAEKPLSVKEIVGRIQKEFGTSGKDPLSAVRIAVIRRARKGTLRRVSPGKYAVATSKEQQQP